ncbi:MAG: MarR family transcriptional regulator [Sphingomonadaceae bacterium]|nr:MarR family transcriptional regulator [Sphingomonadaceae bacterium]
MSDPVSLPRSIGTKLSVVARQLRHRFDERLGKTGGTRAKWMLIGTVAANPGATQRMIATRLEVTDVTAGRLIDRIVAEGLLERREHPQDRRAYCVYLTGAAQPLLDMLARTARTLESEVFAGFSDGELELLGQMLDRLARNIGSIDATPRERETKP